MFLLFLTMFIKKIASSATISKIVFTTLTRIQYIKKAFTLDFVFALGLQWVNKLHVNLRMSDQHFSYSSLLTCWVKLVKRLTKSLHVHYYCNLCDCG